MSHFTVLVIGDNPEEQLAPYHEFECTGFNDQYVQDIDVTEECKIEGLDYHGLEDKMVQSYEDVDLDGDHKYGYAIMKGDELVKAVNRTNPNKKWDWYVLGGRWSGSLLLKNGGKEDSAIKKDIDFDRIKAEAAKNAQEEYDKAMSIIGDLPENESWESVRGRISNIEEAREYYWSQPRCVAWKTKASYEIFGFSGPDKFLISKDEFVQNAIDSSFQTFAVVKNGEWYEKGKMGWFAFVSDEKEQSDWNKEFSVLIDSLPDDTLLSVYDCHI